MTEIRTRPRLVIFLLIIFGLIFWYVSIKTNQCSNNLTENFQFSSKIIYAITPTYARPVQKAELTRLSHVIMLVPNIHWIIIEDSEKPTSLVANLILRTQLNQRTTILYAKTPDEFKLKPKDPNWVKPRGVIQRNLALKWIRENVPENGGQSTVYFMDDDNSYSIELFQEISKIDIGRVGVWPVGLVGGLMVEKPILDMNTKKVIGFNAAWRPDRPFPIDMAGFAISTQLLFQFPKAIFSYEIQLGYQESEILRNLVIRDDLQPLANDCTEILVWHTRTEKPKLIEELKLIKLGKSSNANMEV